MKRLFNIAFLKVKLMLKDKTTFVWMLVAPIVFVVVLTFAFGGGGSSEGEAKYPAAVVNMDGGSYSQRLIEMLKSDDALSITEQDYDTAKKNVEDGSISLGLIIPDGFSEGLDSKELKPMGILKLQDNESTMALSTVVYNYVYQLKVSVDTAHKTADVLYSMGKIKNEDMGTVKGDVSDDVLEKLASPVISYKSENVSSVKREGMDNLSQTAIGIFVIFIMFFITGAAGAMLEEKETGTWNRLVACPVRNYSIIGGFTFGSLIQGWIQVGLLVIFSRFVFNINWGNSILGICLLFTCFLPAVIGLGIALSSFVKTKAQLSILSPLVVMPTCLIAGCMWPREVMPDFMQSISNFMPQTWLIKGMTDLVARGSEISAVFIPCVVLMVFAVVFFITGLTILGYRNR